MRLKYLYIYNYKNLKDFALEFDNRSFIDVFVGKNGTGKSNFFEALIEIFRHLYEKDYFVYFDYFIEYELEGNIHFIHWDWSKSKWFDKKHRETSKILKSNLPDNILIYYSGHNEKVLKLINDYENKFKKGIKEANQKDTREFIGIGKDYKSLLLAVLLLQPPNCKSKQFILSKLGISSISNELEIILKRPFYARKKGYDVDRFAQETRFWKAKGITQEFLDRLSKIATSQAKGVRDEGYLSQGADTFDDKYRLFLDVKDFQNKFSDITPQDLFRNFDNLKTIEMLEGISLGIQLNDGTSLELDNFSDGQFQSIYIYTIIELFKDKNCLTLLDEPDSFLHPEWQFDFLKQVFVISENSAVNNHTLMSSHSATTLAPLNNTPLINLFTIEKNSVVSERISKARAIDTLSGGKIFITENEARLNIIHFLNSTTGAVLFTEGISDEIIFETAWNKLYPDIVREFEIQNAFDCSFLRNLIIRGNLFESDPNRVFFSIFDFDEAYKDWKQLGDIIETNPLKSLTRKLNGRNSYSMLLPVPNIDAISKQVLNPHTGDTFEHNALLTIELLFSQVTGLERHFSVDKKRTDGFIRFTGDKVNFAKNIVPNLQSEHFEVFRPIFDFIINKI